MPSRTELLPVIDAHHHVGDPGTPWFGDDWIRRDLDARRVQMKRMGIDRCVILPAPGAAGGFRNSDHANMNDSICRYAEIAGDTVEAAAATVNPAEVGAACEELERAFTQLRMQAVVFHHRFLGMIINDPRMDSVLHVAAEHGRAVFVHVISDSTLEAAWRLFALARRFPSVRFLALDGFSSANQAAMLREWAPDFPNVWFDTGAMTSVAHGLGAFIETCGAEKLVLGTDLYSSSPHFRQAFPVLELGAMNLRTETWNLICNRNIRTVLSGASG